jgi:hypothetical protein
LRVSEAVSLKTTDLVVEGGQYTHVNIRRGKGGKPGRRPLGGLGPSPQTGPTR